MGGLDKSPPIQLKEADLSAVSIEPSEKISGKAPDQFFSNIEESVRHPEEIQIPSGEGRRESPNRRACESHRELRRCRGSVDQRSVHLRRSSPLVWVSCSDSP